jgi:hypothetical protein
MSIVEDGGSRVSPGLTRAIGYALMALAAAAAIWNLAAPGATAALAAIVLTAAAIAIPAATPELFEVKGRWGGRGFNGLALLPPMFVAVSGVQVSLVDSLVPWIAAAAGAVAGVTIGLVQMSRPGIVGRGQLLLVQALAVGAFAFGATSVADARFDPSDGSAARTTVADKYVGHGRSTSYNLKLAPWGPVSDVRTVSVSSTTYDALNPGDPVCLTLHPGGLGLAWYVLADCQGR